MRRAVTAFLPLLFALLFSGTLQAQQFGQVIYVGDNTADIFMADLTNANYSKVEFYRGAKLLGTVNLNAQDGRIITDYGLAKGNPYQYQFRAYRTAGGFLDGTLIDGIVNGGDMRGILLHPDTISMQVDMIDSVHVWPGGDLHFAKGADVSWILGSAGNVPGLKVFGSSDPGQVWHGVFSASGGRLKHVNVDCYGQVGPLKDFTLSACIVDINNPDTETNLDNVTLNSMTIQSQVFKSVIMHSGNKIRAIDCALTEEALLSGAIHAENCVVDGDATIVGSSVINTVVNMGQLTIKPAGMPTRVEHCTITNGNVSLSNKTIVRYNEFGMFASLNLSPFGGGFDPTDVAGVHVNYNHFVRTLDQIGNVSNFQADSIDARFNYWGRCEGPKSSERASMGKVFIDPFLRVEYPESSYWGEIIPSKTKIIANGEDSIVFSGHFYNVITGKDTAGVVVNYRIEIQGEELYNGSTTTDAQGFFSLTIKVPAKYSQVTGAAAYFTTNLQCIEKAFFLTIEKQTGPDLEVYNPEIVQVLKAENAFVPNKGFAVKATILSSEPVTTPFKVIVEANGTTYETFHILKRDFIAVDYSMENPLTEMTMASIQPVTLVWFVDETGFGAGDVEVVVTVDPTDAVNTKGRIVEANEFNNSMSAFAVAKNTLYGNEGNAALSVFVQGAENHPNPGRVGMWADSTADFLEAAWPMSVGQTQFTTSDQIADYGYIGAADTLLQETWQPYLTKVYKQMVLANPAFDRYMLGVPPDWFETKLDRQEFNHGASQTLLWSGIWDFTVASTDHWKHGAHVLGHTFNLRRQDLDPDNIDMKEQYHENFIGVDVVDGYDIRYDRIVSNFLENKASQRMKAKCFMGGSQLPDPLAFNFYIWINDIEYNALLGAVEEFTTRKSGLRKGATIEKALFVEGVIDSSSRGITFGPWARVADATPSSMVPATYATHTFKVLDASDQEIASYLYRPTFRALGLDEVDAMTGPDPLMEKEHFAFVVPCPDNARKVIVEEGGSIVAERIISQNKPVVTINFPTNMEDVKDEKFLASWSATDPDGETQFWYTVWFSTNRGTTWSTVQFENEAMADSIFGAKHRSGYMLRVVANDGVNNSDPVEVEFSILTSAERVPTPAAFELRQNYPNPFNPSTSLSFTLPTAGEVSLTIFDALGRQVEALVEGYRGAGTHHATFNAAGLPSGSYLAVLRSGNHVASVRMTLAR
ncbi:MAG: T9SS type A sorting domain-containing protein [Bacteroidota bacterium]|nr:T9SS type A sorting domain-containing protein [Bacteroidota bacterium]